MSLVIIQIDTIVYAVVWRDYLEQCIAKVRLGMIALTRGTIWGTSALLRTGNSS